MNKNLLIITLCSIAIISVKAQEREALRLHMSEVRVGKNKPIPPEILNTANVTELLANLQPYTSDTSDHVRAEAFYIYKRIGHNNEDVEIRQEAITELIFGIRDFNSGISGNASEALIGFNKQDFTDSHKAAIANYIKPETPHLHIILKLAGYIEIPNDYFDLIINSNLPFKFKWAAHLASARNSDQNAIDYLLSKVQDAFVNDDFIYDIVPDLIYTRQLEIYKFLKTIIQSNEATCLSADPDSNQKILCGYRVMEYLAPVIVDFPIPLDEFGEPDIKDYRIALEEVREWFDMHPDYEIRVGDI